MNWTYLYCFLISFKVAAHFEEFLYPVATIMHEEQEKCCVLHQKNDHLELWFWDPQNDHANKALLSAFTPAGLTVLPNKKAFSFIDHDRVRIKYVDKRSPRSIDLYGPYDLTTLFWIDNETFYFAAKERKHSNLFHATVEGDLFRLTVSNCNDYFYPQKIEDQLFFIEKSEEKGYCIAQIEYPIDELNKAQKKYRTIDLKTQMTEALQETENTYKPFLNLKNMEPIISFKDGQTIAFLQMLSTDYGFFLKHPETIHCKDDLMHFSYHSLFYKEGGWQTTELFNFTLPLHLLLPQRGRIRLYESILPLLPYYDKEEQCIYFVDYTLANDSLNVFSYHFEDQSIEQKTETHLFGQNYFTPRMVSGSLFCGGTVIHDRRSPQDPGIDIDTSGTQYFSLFKLSR